MAFKDNYAKSYVYSHKSKGYGERYQNTFGSGYYGIEWTDIEKPLLKYIFENIPTKTKMVGLDFACGTGRITNLLSKYVERVFGVDVSDEMLKMTKSHTNVTYLKKNIIEHKIDRKFDIVTAFRFFLNAEPKLRETAMEALSLHAKDGAYLIANIHVNSNSPVGFLYRTRNKLSRKTVNRTMSHSQFLNLAEKYGFTHEKTYWYGYIPRLGPYQYPFMRKIMKVGELLGNKYLRKRQYFAQSFIIQLRKVKTSNNVEAK